MLRVLDLSCDAAGGFATMLLAELGADVVKVEPPAGDPRRRPPEAPTNDLTFDYLNRHKRGVTIDLASRGGRAEFLRQVEEADVVVESFPPGRLSGWGLSYRTLKRVHPRLVLTSITPFGQSGPRSDWKATELVLQAMGGVVAASGHSEGPPVKLAGSQAAHVAGLHAAISTLAAVHGVRAGVEDGVHIDVSVQEVMSTHWTREISRYVYTGQNTARPNPRLGLQGFPHTVEARDGYLFLLALRAEWEAFAHFLGIEQFATHEWSDPETRIERWDEIEPHFAAAIAARDRHEWFAAGADRGYTLAPIDDPHSLLESPQLAARGFMKTARLTSGDEVLCPGLPFSFAAQPRGPNRAPELGEHNEELLPEREQQERR